MQKLHPEAEYTEEDARDELIARASEDMFVNSKEIKSMLETMTESEKKTFVDKVKEMLQSIKDWFNGLLENSKSKSKEAKVIAEQVDRIDEQIRLWEEMLKESIKTNQALKKEEGTTENKKDTTENGDVQYSIRENFTKEYDAWDKKKSRFSFNVGTTSKVLQSLGVKDTQIRWDATKILKIQAEHPAMIDEIIKQVPQILENPVLVLKSKTVEGRLVLFGDVYDTNNVPVLAALELNPTSKKGMALDLIKIASAYGKDVGLQHFIDTSEVVYTDKKRIDSWLKLNRLKLPLANRINSNNIIRQGTKKSQEKFSDRDYSYDTLVSKPDMKITKLPTVADSEFRMYRNDTSLFAKNMRKIATDVGNEKNTLTSTYLYNIDSKSNVLITKESYKHGAGRLDVNYVAICKALPDILKNAIVVNELEGRADNNGGYVMLGIAENTNNYNIVRLIVNKKMWQLESYEELYAIKKKTSAKSLPNSTRMSNKGQMSSTISISNFLSLVNGEKLGSSVLSTDVIEKFGNKRLEDDNITPSLQFSLRENVDVYELLGEKKTVRINLFLTRHIVIMIIVR